MPATTGRNIAAALVYLPPLRLGPPPGPAALVAPTALRGRRPRRAAFADKARAPCSPVMFIEGEPPATRPVPLAGRFKLAAACAAHEDARVFAVASFKRPAFPSPDSCHGGCGAPAAPAPGPCGALRTRTRSPTGARRLRPATRARSMSAATHIGSRLHLFQGHTGPRLWPENQSLIRSFAGHRAGKGETGETAVADLGRLSTLPQEGRSRRRPCPDMGEKRHRLRAGRHRAGRTRHAACEALRLRGAEAVSFFL